MSLQCGASEGRGDREGLQMGEQQQVKELQKARRRHRGVIRLTPTVAALKPQE